MLLFDVRPLADARPTGVHGMTRALAAAVAARLPPGEFLGVANAADAAARGRIGVGPGAVRVRRFPNKLLHAGMRFLGWPTLEALAGVRGPATVVSDPHFLAVRPDSTLLLVIHDLSYFREPAFFSPRVRLWHRLVNFPRLIARADRLLVFSEHTRRDLRELFGVPAEKIVRLTPGAPDGSPPAAAAQAALRVRLGLPREYALLLGAGARKNVRGAALALAAAHALPELGLVVVAGGEDPERVAATLRAVPGIAGRWRVIRHLSDADRRIVLSGARVLLYPSFYEGFGLPPLEAMALGVPVVAGQHTSIGEVTGPHAVLADPHDAASLALALERTVLEPEATAARVVAARAHAAGCRWEDAADVLLATAAAARHAPLRSARPARVVHYRHAHRD